MQPHIPARPRSVNIKKTTFYFIMKIKTVIALSGISSINRGKTLTGKFRIRNSGVSLLVSLFVIPAESGIQLYQMFTACLDSSRTRSGIYRSDDFQGSHFDKNAITYCYYMTLR